MPFSSRLVRNVDYNTQHLKPRSNFLFVDKKPSISRSYRCGLVFPVGRVHRLLKTSKLLRTSRVSAFSSAYLTAVLEYLTSEILDLAGRVAKETKRKTISPRAIMLAVRSDDELFKMLPRVTFPFSGTLPYICPALLPEKAKRRLSPRSASKSPKSEILRTFKMPHGQTLVVVRADVADLAVDAVVNPTNESLYMGGMVGSRLMEAGGSDLAQIMTDARNSVTHLQKNSVFVTEAGRAKAKNLIHVNGPTWKANCTEKCVEDLRKSIQNCLTAADKKGFGSIALPSVGSGRANFPKALAAEVIVSAIKTYLDRGKLKLDTVYFALFDQDSIDAYIYELGRTQ